MFESDLEHIVVTVMFKTACRGILYLSAGVKVSQNAVTGPRNLSLEHSGCRIIGFHSRNLCSWDHQVSNLRYSNLIIELKNSVSDLELNPGRRESSARQASSDHVGGHCWKGLFSRSEVRGQGQEQTVDIQWWRHSFPWHGIGVEAHMFVFEMPFIIHIKIIIISFC